MQPSKAWGQIAVTESGMTTSFSDVCPANALTWITVTVSGIVNVLTSVTRCNIVISREYLAIPSADIRHLPYFSSSIILVSTPLYIDDLIPPSISVKAFWDTRQYSEMLPMISFSESTVHSRNSLTSFMSSDMATLSILTCRESNPKSIIRDSMRVGSSMNSSAVSLLKISVNGLLDSSMPSTSWLLLDIDLSLRGLMTYPSSVFIKVRCNYIVRYAFTNMLYT